MIDTAQVDELKQLLAQRTGLRVPADALNRFVGVLRERAASRRDSTLEEYRAFLLGNEAAGEWEEFARAFTSSETFFFRDHGQFDLLRLRLLPELIAHKRDEKSLRLWSAGCASGEEAYTLAMLVDMLLPERSGWEVFIAGTDIDPRAIAKARQGRYGQWSFRMVPPALRQRYFRPEGVEWVLDERIRSMVTFRVANLVDAPHSNFGPELHDMDLILCRNVFIYFDAAAVSAVATKFAATLANGGYLMTAHTELIGHSVPELESRLFAEGVVYQRYMHPPAEVTPPPVAPGAAVRTGPPLLVQAKPGDGKAQTLPLAEPPALTLCATARSFADRGEYEQAEQLCRQALIADPLAAPPYFLLAQLAQIKGDYDQARECLNKTIYLDHRCVAAYLELAALHERAEDMPRAQALRRAALSIVRAMPDDAPIEQYEKTAGDLAQWLAQWETTANNHDNADNNHARNAQHGK